MKKEKKSNNRGITLIAVVLTVLIATMLIVTISVSFRGLEESNQYYKIKTDIIALSKAAQNYYLENGGELPVLLDNNDNPVPASSEFIENLNAEKNEQGLAKDRNPNDNDYYYEIDVSLLPEVELQKKDNTYYINEATLTVYSNQPYEFFDDEGHSNGKHYTASEKFSGGQFASEYYIGLSIPRKWTDNKCAN